MVNDPKNGTKTWGWLYLFVGGWMNPSNSMVNVTSFLGYGKCPYKVGGLTPIAYNHGYNAYDWDVTPLAIAITDDGHRCCL